MSDLAATNCGCECGERGGTWSNNNNWSWIWIILLFSCCGNNNCGLFSRDSGCGCNNFWWIIILLFCCCGDNNCGCF